MGQAQSLQAQLHHIIYNRDTAAMKNLIETRGQELTSAHVNDNIFAALIERQWDVKTIDFFSKIGTDKQLAIIIASAILHNHAVPIAPLFDRMRCCADIIGEYHLKDLFLTVCERENVDALYAFIANSCYNATDPRPLRVIVQSQLNKTVVDEALLSAVLKSHPQQTENVEWIRKNCLPDARCPEVRKKVDEYLSNYIL